MKVDYKKRIAKLKSTMRKEGRSSALLIGSAPSFMIASTLESAYRQDSNMSYLTGITKRNIILLITTAESPPCLIAAADRELKKEAAAIGAVLIAEQGAKKEVLSRLRGIKHLYYSNEKNTRHWAIVSELMEQASYFNRLLPKSFSHCALLLEPLRLFKNKQEVLAITEALKVTKNAMHGVLPLVGVGAKESDIAETLDYLFAMQGAQPAFNSIVAAGASAAEPHYSARSRTIGRSDLLKVDCGAYLNGYCADVTRVFPSRSRFSPLQGEIYQIVLEAQEKAISAIRPGVRMESLYKKAARILTEGLKELRVLRGDTTKLMAKAAYKPFFPHRLGHSLGVDTHDLIIQESLLTTLKPGMVVTVEPGLYFKKRVGRVPPCGIRIEDDILVTRGGYRNLSDDIPKGIEEVEEWMGDHSI